MVIKAARRIERYEGPSYLVSPGHPATRQLTAAVQAHERAGFVTVLDTVVQGWGAFNAIVRVETPAGYLDPDSIDGDYLVQII